MLCIFTAEAGSAPAAVNRYRHPGVYLRPCGVVSRPLFRTAQNTRELWHCLEGLSIEPFDPDATANWIKHYPGGLTFAE
ncbi:hypothetical protein [Dickeya fangzhongdai]|uniref:Uncharacterized protein n=1 Tax=Dickeya fangzhongdai TaxID=1778540 RepID=A0A2K8QMA7_9GAMM|nr:hypothetical protein CVE23_12140 [Dickeya fangzhongdai]QOH48100.1 hypothetical protein DYD82_12205 [Dickeya fangzhongdai]QOH52401.1 hypothetical protein DYD83_12200 [Dickeya fangzhongdai]